MPIKRVDYGYWNNDLVARLNILLFGGSGFIGKKVFTLLKNENHNVITLSNREIDFTKPNELDVAKIAQIFAKTDIIINMVGVMSNDKTLMENVHHHTPARLANLFKKHSKSQNVKQWINLSALSADPTQKVAFVGSKGRGDNAILNLADANFSVKIARPSLVFGQGGASTEMFLKMAKLPILFLPNGGNFDITVPKNLPKSTQEQI